MNHVGSILTPVGRETASRADLSQRCGWPQTAKRQEPLVIDLAVVAVVMMRYCVCHNQPSLVMPDKSWVGSGAQRQGGWGGRRLLVG